MPSEAKGNFSFSESATENIPPEILSSNFIMIKQDIFKYYFYLKRFKNILTT